MAEEKDVSFADMDEDKLLRSNKKLLDALLFDYSTGKNIRWATNNYSGSGIGFEEEKEIKAQLVTGWYNGLIKPRAEKDHETRLERTRNKAEVFTPSWIVKKQVGAILEEMIDLSFEEFIDKRWLEITCGEGPYMANRYDMLTGEIIALEKRAGFIDEKFRRLNEKVKSEKSWIDWAIRIYKASYGYEYQGDSLLLARENLLLTFIDNYFYMFGDFPKDKLLLNITEIIARNVIQMDGLTYLVPYSKEKNKSHQLSMLEELAVEDSQPVPARIHLWHLNKTVNFIDIVKESEGQMKFDVVIGNPPFMEENVGSNNQKKQIYYLFVDESEKIGDISLLITPARYLFDTGGTPKSWNKKMLNSNILKIIYYEADSRKVFNNVIIKGGVAISYINKNKKFKPIKVFIDNKVLSDIYAKIDDFNSCEKHYISEWVFSPDSYRFEDIMFEENPLLLDRTDAAHRKAVSSNVFERYPEVFFDEVSDKHHYVEIYGRKNAKARTFMYVKESYIRLHDNLHKWKIFVPGASGNGIYGEALGDMEIGKPRQGHNQTFLSIGALETEYEAKSLLKYLKTKFGRALLGIMKSTQNNQSK